MKTKYHVDKADIVRFQTDGVVCLRNVLDGETTARLALALDELTGEIPDSAAGYDLTALRRQIYSSEVAIAGQGAARQHDLSAIAQLVRTAGVPALVDNGSDDAGQFALDTSTWTRNATIRELALDSVLPSIAAQLLRAKKINYCDDQIFIKAPGTVDRTAFHQDYTYFRMQGGQGCVMWICVDHADERSGALSYVRGSHRWMKEFLPNVFMAQAPMPGGQGESLEQIEANPEEYDLVRFETEPGDIIIHHFMTVHGAGGNSSNHPRRALSLRYAGEDMLFHSRPGAPVQPYHEHQLSEGDPLDSLEYPVVWPRPFPAFRLANYYEMIGRVRSTAP